MASMTPEQNMLLSSLLDCVNGTEEMVKIRQDYCKINDCIKSINFYNDNAHYSGSKAEGLDLPSSDFDSMYDINNKYDMEVSESLDDLALSTRKHKLLMVTDNVPPAFVLLKQVFLRSGADTECNVYLGSDMFLSVQPDLLIKSENETRRIQGPSIEIWTEYEDMSQSGVDNVLSIFCKFWPKSAAEWKDRPRHYGWPTQCVKENVETFGFHLVPVGHPLSTKQSLEWRLSFSIAERTLVWSFNHTQFQCYAVMKLILKEVIKTRCSERHKNVLCSYFIKTFLFWKFEETDTRFWQQTNLINCIMFLVHQFYICIQSGVLRHYFISRFNLFEIKLSAEAQTELLHILDNIIGTGIPILGECVSLSWLWSQFCKVDNMSECAVLTTGVRRSCILLNDEGLNSILKLQISPLIHNLLRNAIVGDEIYLTVSRSFSEIHASTLLSEIAIKFICFLILKRRLYCFNYQRNKHAYYCIKMLDKNVFGSDITSSKLVLATFLIQQGDYVRSLKTTNDILSSIPPFGIYHSGFNFKTNAAFKEMYMETYCTRNSNIICRAKEACLTDMYITQLERQFMLPAVQVELYFGDQNCGIYISPFTYAYYLMFLCYHGLGQYDNRDSALRQLSDIPYDKERCGAFKCHAFNIAGHCLLLAGYVELARNMFLESARNTHSLPLPVGDKYNAAYIYLSCM